MNERLRHSVVREDVRSAKALALAVLATCGLAPAAGAEPARGAVVGLRRLTSHEYDNGLRDLLRDPSRPSRQLLPADRRTPFDNDYTGQVASKALVEALDLLGR